MTTFLCWNVHNKRLDGLIVELAKAYDVDVLFLLEHPKPDSTLFKQLQPIGKYQRVASHTRFAVYVKFDSSHMRRIMPRVTNNRIDFWELRLSPKNAVLLALVHGLDIVNNSQHRRGLFFESLVEEIRWIEEHETKHKQTIVLGDFNANPFDPIVGGIKGLHAIRLKDVGGKVTRRVLGKNYEFFCNPMWSCFKGWEKSPPGTHYYNGSDVHEIFWHMIDQVVLRPQVLSMFAEKNLRVVTEAGSCSLITKQGLPDAKLASDHLPILFTLDLDANGGK